MTTREELGRGLEAAPMGLRMAAGQQRPMRSKVKVVVVAGEVGDGGGRLTGVEFKGSGRRQWVGGGGGISQPAGWARSGTEGSVSDEICEFGLAQTRLRMVAAAGGVGYSGMKAAAGGVTDGDDNRWG
ncbi:hypothetical protein GUJ93_ZPchr0014g46912 [Zizania palustris]|uniref:Uncharacterized protein n=1 Tax=Zizania palustris TaxID=103762 RepID=A0A8J5TFS2_ZIZPA|nr:hypothetical protein GUJ93_ZPchr0014g46912 [Zizania palustris]